MPRVKWIAAGAMSSCEDAWNSTLDVSPSAPFSSDQRTLPVRTDSLVLRSYCAFSARTVTGAPPPSG